MKINTKGLIMNFVLIVLIITLFHIRTSTNMNSTLKSELKVKADLENTSSLTSIAKNKEKTQKFTNEVGAKDQVNTNKLNSLNELMSNSKIQHKRESEIVVPNITAQQDSESFMVKGSDFLGNAYARLDNKERNLLSNKSFLNNRLSENYSSINTANSDLVNTAKRNEFNRMSRYFSTSSPETSAQTTVAQYQSTMQSPLSQTYIHNPPMVSLAGQIYSDPLMPQSQIPGTTVVPPLMRTLNKIQTVFNPVPVMTHYKLPVLHHIPINKVVKKYIPVYYPIPVEHRINIPVKVPIRIPQKILIPQAVPYGVKVPVPVPVKVEVPRYREIEIKKPVYVKIPVYEHIPIYHHFAVKSKARESEDRNGGNFDFGGVIVNPPMSGNGYDDGNVGGRDNTRNQNYNRSRNSNNNENGNRNNYEGKHQGGLRKQNKLNISNPPRNEDAGKEDGSRYQTNNKSDIADELAKSRAMVEELVKQLKSKNEEQTKLSDRIKQIELKYQSENKEHKKSNINSNCNNETKIETSSKEIEQNKDNTVERNLHSQFETGRRNSKSETSSNSKSKENCDDEKEAKTLLDSMSTEEHISSEKLKEKSIISSKKKSTSSENNKDSSSNSTTENQFNKDQEKDSDIDSLINSAIDSVSSDISKDPAKYQNEMQKIFGNSNNSKSGNGKSVSSSFSSTSKSEDKCKDKVIENESSTGNDKSVDLQNNSSSSDSMESSSDNENKYIQNIIDSKNKEKTTQEHKIKPPDKKIAEVNKEECKKDESLFDDSSVNSNQSNLNYLLKKWGNTNKSDEISKSKDNNSSDNSRDLNKTNEINKELKKFLSR